MYYSNCTNTLYTVVIRVIRATSIRIPTILPRTWLLIHQIRPCIFEIQSIFLQCIQTMTSLAREAESCIWSERFFEDILRAHSIADEQMDVTHTT